MTVTARAHLRDALALMATALGRKLAEARLPATEDYDVVRADLVNRLTDAFLTFVSTARGGGALNAAKRALTEDIPAAFYRGYKDAGGEEVDDADEKWLTATQATQVAWMDNTFEGLKVQRDNDSATESGLQARAEVWGKTLDGIYSEGRLRASKNITLEFDGDDGAESCKDCQKLKGKRRTIKWILEHDMIPRPGNENFECGGWKCEHFWKNPKTGERYTF